MNNFREWLSDNLRYIMLIAGILVILIGLFFGVRAISNRIGRQNKDNFSSDSVISNGGTAAAASTSAGGVSEASSTASSSEEGGPLLENAVPEVNSLIQQYFTALGSKDADAVRKLCDTLPEDEASKISSNEQSDYTNITVYTKNGPTEDSYVVYVYYHYKKEGQSETLPGLSQMLVRKGSDGTYKIVYSDYDQTTSDYINRLSQQEDVRALVSRVQKEYDTATGNTSSSSSAASGTTSPSETAEATPVPTSAPEAASTPAPTSQATPAPTREVTPTPTRRATPTPTRRATPVPTKAPSNSVRQTTVLSTCWVRSKPGYDGTIIGRVNTGDVITVIGDRQDGWYHIRTDSLEGYIGYHFIN